MNVPLFTLLVFLTIAYFADEVMAFFPEDVQVKYYQLWMELQGKELGADPFPHSENRVDHQATYIHSSFQKQQMSQFDSVPNDLVFGLTVIYEHV